MSEMDALDWWPKPLGPGDTIGDSARKILGKPDLDPVEVLVREPPNSWDAHRQRYVSFLGSCPDTLSRGLRHPHE